MIIKKSLWVGLIGAAVIFGATIVYPRLNAVVHISKNGFTFTYPKNLIFQTSDSTEGNYANYEFFSVDEKGRSAITVSIPLKNTSTAFTMLENNQPFGKASDVKPSTLNGHAGQMMTYRQDSDMEGDMPLHGRVIAEQYTTRYTTSPVILRFFRNDNDSSLDMAWEKIRSSIRY